MQSDDALQATCYKEKDLGQLCTRARGGDGLCVATWNGEPCRSCRKSNLASCYDSISLTWEKGPIDLDCQNIFPQYSSMEICGNELGITPAKKTYHRSSSSSNDSGDNAAGMSLFIIFVVVFLVVRMKIRRCFQNSPSYSYSGVARASQPQSGTEMTAVQAAEYLGDDGLFSFFDSTAGDDDATILGQAVDAGNWQVVRDLMASHQSTWTCNERSQYIGVIQERISKAWPATLAQDTTFSPLLDAWYANEPENPDCLLLRLLTLCVWAWHARTGQLASQVTPDQALHFRERLDQARLELPKALELSPQDPSVYGVAIIISKGCDPDNERVKGYLRSVQTSKDQFHYYVYVYALDYYSYKWHGTHETMFNLCRATVGNLPHCHPLWSLVPMAHHEQDRATDRHWLQAETRREILSAYDQAMGNFETSWDSSLSRGELVLNRRMRTWFSYACIKANLLDQARRQVRLLGKHPSKGTPFNLKVYRRYIQALGFAVDEVLPTAPATEIV